jgi:hypothetical protein
MKITYIHAPESKQNTRVVFMTDPPMTEEVFKKFLEPGSADHFEREGDLLVLKRSGFGGLVSQFKGSVEQRLTQAEESIEREKQEAANVHKTFVRGIEKSTGINIYWGPK